MVVESNENVSGGLVADFSAHGVWEPQVEALFDVCVVNADTPSYICNRLSAGEVSE